MNHDDADRWKATVRMIFDELHFGKDSLFRGQSRAASTIISIIEDRHPDYFCEGKTMKELADD